MLHLLKFCSKAISIFILLTSINTASQELISSKQFDQFVKSELKKWNVPGAAIAVVKDGKIIYTKGFGYRNVKEKLKADEHTLFAIGSLTKSITASTVGILVDQKKVQWDSKIIDLLPNFKLKDDFATQRINFVDLLSHRTGLPSHNLMWYVTNFSRESIVNRLRYLEPSSDFRTTFSYNPNMYTLAGYVVGKQSGMTWEAFTKKNIFDPLNMNRSNFTYMDMIKDLNHSRPYIEKNGEVVETTFHQSQHFSAPAGSVNSSVNEMANWLILNLNQGKFNGQQVITPESLNYIHSPHMTFPSTSSDIGVGPEGAVGSYSMYGLGWFMGTYYDQIIVEHAGAIDGFSSKMTLLPRQNIGIVIFNNNQMGGDMFCTTVTNRITTILMNKKSFDFSGWFTDQGIGELKPSVKPKVDKKQVNKLTRNLEEYVGEYSDNGYGSIKISIKDGQLQFKYYRYDVRLEHINHDIFKTINGIVNRKINFIPNTDNQIERIEVQWDRSVSPIIFKRI